MAPSPLDNQSVVRDPIHGFIEYNSVEEEILNSAPFQRLRNIKQLGPTSLVYPGAEHTRFQHSIGVMHVASRIFELIVPKWKVQLQWHDDDARRNKALLRLASLLHDVGHGPLSHTSESLFPDGFSHITYSSAIVSSPPISDIIDGHSGVLGFDSRLVADLIAGEFVDPKAGFLREILSGDLDADRMDYLLRDSHFCGVQYGKYDLDRLLHTLTIREDLEAGNWLLAIKEGGVHAAEGMILARYFMFTQVYFHDVSRSYEHHITDFMKNVALIGGRFPPDVSGFLTWDDVRMVELLKQAARDGNVDARRVLGRSHFREVAATTDHMNAAEDVWWRAMLAEFLRLYAGVQYFADESEKAPHKFYEADFHVVLAPARTVPIIARSDLAASLKRIYKMRLYVPPERAPAVKEFCRDHHLQFGPKR